MDLEVVGRHALLFDDDAMAGFVNSADALVEWHSLQIDRYDVRHLLSAPPPSRRRNRNYEPLLLDNLSLEAELDHERYLDLPTQPDQPDVEEDEHRSDTSGYRSVAFSYGNSEGPADQKNNDARMESSGFLPQFPIPEELRHCLPPTEKVHQIIARTAAFVSKHGGQSEIILRVKQGDNPTFGFLMPGQHLHAYFRYLVEHPELLLSESDGNSRDERKMTGTENNNANSVGGSLSLLGSVYGSGEEEEGDDAEKTNKDACEDQISSGNHRLSHALKKVDSQFVAAKNESVSKNPTSNKEKIFTVKKNSSITASKPGAGKGMEEKSHLASAAADKAKSLTTGTTSKIDPSISEPPPELKRLIDKIVEFIMRNGKQFEATLIEQDSKHGRFPFLLPSNQYHSYYLKILQTAQESKNSRSFYSVSDDLVGRRMEKKTSLLKEKDFSSLTSDVPFESDRKEKFKMVISKSKKETQDTESQGTQQDNGVTLDAAATAAILQAAARGIKISNLQFLSSTSPNAHVHVNSCEGGGPGELGSGLPPQLGNAVDESCGSGTRDVSAVAPKQNARTVSPDAACEVHSSESHFTEEQKLKAERLKRAKMFVAMLKSGEVPFNTGRSRGSSLEPVESGTLRFAGESNDGKERQGSLAPPDVDLPAASEKPKRNYFPEEQQSSKRKYRSRSGECEDDKEHNDHRSKKNFRSRSGRNEEGSERVITSETEERVHKRRHQTPSEEREDEGESSEEDWDDKTHRTKHRSHHSEHVEACEDKYKDEKNHKRSKKKHRSHHSSREHSRTRRSSKHLSEDDEHADNGRGRKKSRKRHHSHRSSHHSRDKHRRRSRLSSRERESHRNRSHDTSSDEHPNLNCRDKQKNKSYEERDGLEEGEIGSKVSEECREIESGHIRRETSADEVSFQQRASSQPPDCTTDVPDDLRAKIRAMLMATRS